MSKYDVVIMLFCVIFFSAAMCAHFGYSVDGVKTNPKEYIVDRNEWVYHDYGVISWWENVNTGEWRDHIEPEKGDILTGTFKFMYDMMAFRIDNVPAVFSYLYIFINLLALFLLYYAIRSGT